MKVVTAGIINRESQFLVARRAANQKLPGFWEFPGGKVETGETLQACVERELLEELGVSAVAGEVLMGSRYDYDHGAILLVAIHAELLSLDFQLTVHDEIRWVINCSVINEPPFPAVAEFEENAQSALEEVEELGDWVSRAAAFVSGHDLL